MKVERIPSEQYSHHFKITPDKGKLEKTPFTIPVVDVRDGEEARKRAKQMTKGYGSKYMSPTYAELGNSYQVSQKRID